MFHQKIPRGAQRQGGDARVGPEEALVVAVVGDAVVAVGVVVDQAEVVARPRRRFRRAAQPVQTRRDRTRVAGAIPARKRRDRLPRLRVDQRTVGVETGAGVDAEDGGAFGILVCGKRQLSFLGGEGGEVEISAPAGILRKRALLLSRRVDQRLRGPSFDCVLHPVEEQLSAQELEQIPLDAFGYVRLEIQQVQIGPVVDLSALGGRCASHLVADVRWKVGNGEWVGGVIRGWSVGGFVVLGGGAIVAVASFLRRDRGEEGLQGPFFRHS